MKTKTIVLSVVASALPALCIANNKLNMVIGTYTDNGSKGVYSFLFDQQTGKHETRQHSTHTRRRSVLIGDRLTRSYDGKLFGRKSLCVSNCNRWELETHGQSTQRNDWRP